MKSKLELRVTMVADEFIDRYMAAANGEYVKVYLYILRHQDRDVTVVEMADALNHTESDVRRALAYWERLGILAEQKQETAEEKRAPEKAAESAAVGGHVAVGGYEAASESAAVGGHAAVSEPVGEPAASESAATAVADKRIPSRREAYTPEQVGRLAQKEEFTQLLYISQKFMNKVFTPRECEVFAYLYDGLQMSSELLEYLVEYCVQGGHYNIRYLETVALSWKEKGITTVDMARRQAECFTGDTFGVMRAFGLQDRNPGSEEFKYIRRWCADFSRDVVLEACNRTIRTIQKPSFSYADKILSQWKSAGVRSLADVRRRDEKRESEQGKDKKPGAPQPVVKPKPNQFHNFHQRDTDYDAIVLERLKQRLGE